MALPRLQILSSDRIVGVDGAEGSGPVLMDKVRLFRWKLKLIGLGKSKCSFLLRTNLSVCLPRFVTRKSFESFPVSREVFETC